MTNEIKEILQLIGSCCYYGKISEVECKKYCNYITNLQEENKHLLCRMGKAVDYIISTYHDEPTELYGLVCADELLDILRGDE